MPQEWPDKPKISRLATKIEGWLDDIVNVSLQGENTSLNKELFSLDEKDIRRANGSKLMPDKFKWDIVKSNSHDD